MLNLSQTQKQTLRISPSQIQLLNFLQLSTIELEEHIKTELEENKIKSDILLKIFVEGLKKVELIAEKNNVKIL